MNRETDLRYKLEMQDKLYRILSKDFFKPEEIMKILTLNKSQLKKIIKTLVLHKEGYAKEDIIRALMGGKIYEAEIDNPRETVR